MPRTLLGQIFVGVVVILAAGLRLVALDLTAFNIDEARLCIAAGSVMHGGGFPWHGVRTSFGFHNPPLMVWLAVPPLAATPNPLVAMTMLALGGVAAAAMAGHAVARVFSAKAGAATLAIVAFSPAAVDHCRRLWGHDTMVFWSALALWLAVHAVSSRRWIWLAASGAAAACAQACHLSGALVWAIPVGAAIAFPMPGRAKAAALAIAFAAAIYAPWVLEDAGLVGEPRATRFEQLRLVAATALGKAEGAGTPGHSSTGVSWLTVLADLRNNDHMAGEYPEFLDARPALNGALLLATVVLALLQVAGIGVAAARAWKERPAISDETRWMCVLAVAALASLVVFAALPTPTVPPYQLPALVPCAALAGVLAAKLLREDSRWIVDATIVLAFFSAWHALAVRQHLAHLTFDSRAGGLLRHKYLVVDYIAAMGGRGPYTIMQDGRGADAGVDYWVAYLHAASTGRAETPTKPTDRVFVVRDARTKLRTVPLAFLEASPGIDIGIFRVYELKGSRAGDWRATVAQYPSSGE